LVEPVAEPLHYSTGFDPVVLNIGTVARQFAKHFGRHPQTPWGGGIIVAPIFF
jgi:hypothetical protein